ncbi:hypothetical protein HU200_018778 [Digitaria exilis]|uniref:USP domain-containing protein n=1 Tax=Digitaria exilis TaxID=1010633 RepID=A0A835KJ07_9POAL|nr:hypothetical protein HU200_018778 [Digitaria exilis]
MAAVDAAEAVVQQMPVEPPPIAADAVVEPPPIAADEAAETVVEPPPVAADAVVERPPAIVADAMETVGTPSPEAADDEEAAAAAPMSAVPPPPPPPEQKLEQKLPSIVDDQKPCDMVNSTQRFLTLCICVANDQLDSDDLSDDSPTRNSNDDSDYSGGAYHCHYDSITCWHDPYYRFFGGERKYGHSCASVRFCCFCSLKLHVDESIRLSGSAFYPESFVNHLKLISSNFERGVQQDAQEFLCDLLEKLDEASIAPKSSLEEPSSTEGGIAKEIFGGLLKSQLRCPKCNRCSDKSEPFLDLSLEVTMVDSLIDALQSFTKVELIEDYMCDGCKCRVNMEKHFKIEQAPEVLVIHLKRFTNSGGKICDKVKYPLELHVDSFMSSSDYLHGPDLSAVQIFRRSEASVLDSAAYLLFYVKQGSSPWFSTLLEKEDKCQQDGSVNLAEQGASEIALIGNEEEKLTSSPGLGSSGYCLVGLAEENGNVPSLSDLSQDIQRNGNANALLDAADKLEEGCCLDGMSGGIQELSCLVGSGSKSGHADEFLEPWEMEDVRPGGSLDMTEMNPSTFGFSEVDPTEPHGASPPKRESNFLVQLEKPAALPRMANRCNP